MRHSLIFAVIAASLIGSWAVAQTAEMGPEAVKLAELQAKEAAQRAERLEREAAAATDLAARSRAEAEAVIARIQALEAEMSAAEARIRIVEALRVQQRARLAEKQEPVIRLTAALQTMAARPPALALVQPGSVDDMIRVRALLASTLPVVRERTAGLRAEVEAGSRLRAQAERAAAALAASRSTLDVRRTELAQIEKSQSQRAQGLAASALLESERSVALGEEARDLAREMQGREHRRRLETELAALPGPIPRPSSGSATDALRPPPYLLPVGGRVVTGMGELSDAGVHARGLTFETAANSPVVAPRDGTVVYAGRFRTYGEVVIIDHGGGWTSTLTNLAALRVRQGDTVRAGDPIGRSGRQVTVELRRGSRPHSITAFIRPVAAR